MVEFTLSWEEIEIELTKNFTCFLILHLKSFDIIMPFWRINLPKIKLKEFLIDVQSLLNHMLNGEVFSNLVSPNLMHLLVPYAIIESSVPRV